MKKLSIGVGLAFTAAAALLAAAPALAGDLLYEAAPDSLTEGLDGQPYWSTQAQCAGLFGAAAQHQTEAGDAAEAEASTQLAVTFAKDAVKRLMRDRGLSRKDALLVIEPAVLKGRQDGAGLLTTGATGPRSTWNFARSACMDVADAYRQASY